MKNIEKVLFSRNIRNILSLGAGTFISQAIPIIVMPILSRQYTPIDFGQWGIFNGYASIILVIACLRYEVSIVRADTKKEAFSLIQLSLGLLLSIIVITIFIIFIDSLLKLGIFSQLDFFSLVFLPLYVLFSGFAQILIYIANRLESYKQISISNVSRNIFQAGTRISVGLFNCNTSGLIIGALTGAIVQVVCYFNFIKSNIQSLFSFNADKLFLVAKKYYRFPVYDMPSALLNALSTNLPIILFAKYYTNADTGFFSTSANLLFIPMALLGSAISQVFYKNSCSYNDEEINIFSTRLLTVLSVIGVWFSLICIFWGRDLFSFFLGKEWVYAGIYSEVLILWAFIVLIFSPFSTAFLSKDKQKIGLIFNILLLSLRLMAIILSGFLNLSPFIAILLYTIAGFSVWLIQGIYLVYLLKIKFRKIIHVFVIIGIVSLLWVIKINYSYSSVCIN